MIEYLLQNPYAFRESEKKAVESAGLKYGNWYTTRCRYPAIWKIINHIVIQSINDTHEGRVHMAVADAAVHGNHQDRRLYLELTKKLSRSGSSGKSGSVNIVFVQDSVERPKVSGEGDTTIVTLDSEPSK